MRVPAATGEPLAEPQAPFAALDDLLRDAGAFGTVDVTLASVESAAAIVRHAERRARQIARSFATAAGTTAEVWRELAHRLGAGFDSDEPQAFAAGIARAARGRVLVVPRARATVWGRAVCDELAHFATEPERRLLLVALDAPCCSARGLTALDAARRGPRAIFTAARSAQSSEERSGREGSPPSTRDARARRVSLDLRELASQLGEDESRRWWEALVASDEFLASGPLTALESLDGWWQSVRARGADVPRVRVKDLGLEAPELELLRLLVRAGESLDKSQLSRLPSECLGGDPDQAIEGLVGRGLVSRDEASGQCLVSDFAWADSQALQARPEQDRALVDLLEATAQDAWSMMRAGELACSAGLVSNAQRCAFRALTMVTETTARADLWCRWRECLETFAANAVAQDAGGKDAGGHLARLIASAEHALVLGDSDRADELSALALRCDGNRFDVLLIRGRAMSARGDVTGATLALKKATARAATDAERARAEAVLAETRYLGGDHLEAERIATSAVTLAADQATRLAARNVLGKLLIAREGWTEAEAHFAADALDAAAERLPEAELRAHLNRAVSLLWAGRREEAGRIFSEVYEQGQQTGNKRAMAYALSNLATVAILSHRYADALALSDRAIAVRRQMGEHMLLVLPVTNLAELRLRLGLLEEAEQALRFGLHACGDSLPLSQYAYFAMTSALIHLERGDTQVAARELATARSGACSSGDTSLLGRVERIAARVALEDGDVVGVRNALENAKACRHNPGGKADLARIEAMLARALGEDFLEASERAVLLAQQADDSEHLREAYLLRAQAHAARGEMILAEGFKRRAVEQCERVIATLSPALRERFLARPALAAVLASEEGTLGSLSDEQSSPSVSPSAATGDPSRPRERRLVGDSSTMRVLRGTIRRVASAHTTVLIHGPTGTGKELVAEAIHQASERSRGPLVKVNCAALVETLLLSELFGHEKGAFTGASTRRRGRFELAEGGTLFLDEIGDISPRTQVALLRVLQDGTFERVGGCSSIRSNVRIVCATHRDLRAMVERGEFREDLYYRLCGVTIEVPALKDRLTDLDALCSSLLERAAETAGVTVRPFAPDTLRGLARHGWPGNVRELENALRVAALFAKGPCIELSDFTDNIDSLRYLAGSVAGRGPLDATRPSSPPPPDDRGGSEEHGPSSSTDVFYAEIRGGTGLGEMKKKLEQDCIARALVDAGGNITKAAQLLGMKRPRLSQLVKQYNLGTMLEDIKS
jgi:DNA-binding NtrC family response regulator/tetratricopeptide (TPR) repeat protein